MHATTQHGLTFTNADIAGDASTLRIVESRIASVGEGAKPGDVVIDLHGDRLLPGLINAHDHLHLNNFGRQRFGNQRATSWSPRSNGSSGTPSGSSVASVTPYTRYRGIANPWSRASEPCARTCADIMHTPCAHPPRLRSHPDDDP